MKTAAASQSRLRLRAFTAFALSTVVLAAGSAEAARPTITVSISSPANGSTVSGNVNWQVTVSGDTPNRVDFIVDGKVLSSLTAAPYARTLDTTTLANGQHVLTASAANNQGAGGGNATTTSVTVTVANVATTTTGTGSITGSTTGSTGSAVPPSDTSLPTVSGTAAVGQTMNASPGSWSGTTPIGYAYQWMRCDASGGACSSIAGATSTSYGVQTADVGLTLRVAVVATNAAGSGTATSAATVAVNATTSTSTSSTSTSPLSGVTIGLNGYPSGDTTEQAEILASGVKLLRTDRGDYGVSWAHSVGITLDAIIWMNTSSAGVSADVVELDNEPYYNSWDGYGGVEQWAVKARDVAKAIKAQHPDKKVLLPSLAVTNNGDVLDNGVWTPMLYAINRAAPDIWRYVDGIAIHPYTRPDGPSAVFPNLDHLRSELTTIGGYAASLPFWITEMGWTNTGDVAVSESTAATYMQQLITGLHARADVASLIVYTTSDNPYVSLSEQGYGVYRMDGTAKPVLAVIKAAE
jgi:Bacterial Ig domain/Glycosyl hydrolase catalytic core